MQSAWETESRHTELLRDSPVHHSGYPYPGAGVTLGLWYQAAGESRN